MTAVLAWVSTAVGGSFADDLRSLRQRAETRARAQTWSASAEEALVADLESLVGRFRSAGGPAGSAGSLRRLVQGVHGRYAQWLRRTQDAVIAADGDLEAVQDSPEWREHEALALRTLYHLNWIHLESATRYERRDARRQEWLRQAAEGFGEFAADEGDASLAAESLYGRGLCHRELERPTDAIADFRHALDLAGSADLAPRIQAALVETLIDADRLGEALETSSALLRRRRTAEAEFLRTKVLLLALSGSDLDASRRAAFRREVIDLVNRLERRGGTWARLGRQLAAAGITRPEEWLGERANPTVRWVLAEALRGRRKYREALPLYESVAAAQQPPQPAVLLALGTCQFRLQMYTEAFETLGRVRAAGARGESGADAAYLRFKSAEALHHGEVTPASAARLRTAAHEYLSDFPDHQQAFEAHFRLGELERSEGNLLAAASAFDAVTGEPAFHLQALFQSAQCYVEEWESQGGNNSAEAEDLAADALTRLRNFLDEAELFQRRRGRRAADVAVLAPMQARAHVLGALLLARRETTHDLEEALEWLDGLSERFPEETTLRAQASGIRAVALLGLGRFVSARTAVQEFLSSPHRTPRDYRLLRRLGVRSLELAEARRRAGDPAAAQTLQQTALHIYEELLRAVRSGAIEGESPEGLQQLIARLRPPQGS